MADDPIQVDDGGSTRIKLHLRKPSFGEMDKLLDVEKLIALGKPYHELECGTFKANQRNSPYGNVRITYLDPLGNPFSFTQAFAELEIKSGVQRIHVEVLAAPNAGDAQITVYSVGCPQIMDVKQHNKKRRYVITNAPPIDEVLVTAVAGGPSVLVYAIPRDASPATPATPTTPAMPAIPARPLIVPAPTPPGVVASVLYTSVVIT